MTNETKRVMGVLIICGVLLGAFVFGIAIRNYDNPPLLPFTLWLIVSVGLTVLGVTWKNTPD